MPSESVENYLEAIYRIGGETGTVNTCDLAEQLKVTPPSVTTMLRRLSRDGFIKHIRYRGISLTQLGFEMASSTIRRHRLSERILTDVFGIPWERVHEFAGKLEHVLTGELEEKAYEILGEPERCPHGSLLEGSEERALIPLSEAPTGEILHVVKITEECEEFLRAAAEIGLVPCADLSIDSSDKGFLALLIDGHKHTIDAGTASRVWVSTAS